MTGHHELQCEIHSYIHHPINPETFAGKAHDYAGIVKPVLDIEEY